MGKKKEKMANLIRIYYQHLFAEAVDQIVEAIHCVSHQWQMT